MASELETTMGDQGWRDYVEEAVRTDKVPGLAVCAVNGDEVSFANWGYGDIAAGIPVTEDTVFEIGSVSKAFTALAVLLLQEQGKLSVDDSISDYFDWWHVTWQGEEVDVKIWMLINHCAGIPNSQTMAMVPFGTDDNSNEVTARLVGDLELAYAPGERFEYCNMDYTLLAYLVETVSGMYFSDFVEQQIMAPIGMTHSGYDIPTTQGYQYLFGQTVEYDAPRMKGSEGDGYAIVTPRDMALWMQAQMGMLDLPEDLAGAIEASHELIPGHSPEEDPDMVYYNGWIFSEEYGGIFLHGGENPNFCSMLIIDPESQTGVFAVSNIASNAPSYAAYSLYGRLAGVDGLEQPIGRWPFYTMDIICSIMAAVFFVILFCCVVKLVNQKKRLAGKKHTKRKEKVQLAVRLTVLVPLLLISAGAPYIFSYAIGYPGFGYTMIAFWTPWSLLILAGVLDLLFLCLIVTSICRWHLIRRETIPEV